MTPVTNVLAPYGAIGLMAVVALAVARALWLRREAAHDAEIILLSGLLAKAEERTSKAEARADRVTESLDRLNERVRDDYVNTLARASQALADVGRDVAAVRSANARRR